MPGVVTSFESGRKGLVAVTSFGQRPAEIYQAADGKALSDHNKALREAFDWASVEGFDVYYPEPRLCTDNGAMIAYAGACRYAGNGVGGYAIVARPRWPLDELRPPAGRPDSHG